MASVASTIVEKGTGILWGLFLGEIAMMVAGYAGPGGILLAIADDVLMYFLKTGLSSWENFNLSLFFAESEKIVHEANVWGEEDDRQRAARHAALVRWHGQKTYIFGDVSVADFGRLAYSGYTVYRSPLADTIAEWVSSGWEVAMEAVEVAPFA